MNHPSPLPLVVDLDGTLTPVDTLVESYLRLVRHHPFQALLAPLWLARGRAHLKQRIAQLTTVDADTLPLREDLLDYLKAARQSGRRLVLATAANYKIARSVAARVGLFDDCIGSDGQHNLKGSAKLERIRQLVGPDFAYAGDSPADLPIWRASRAAVLVNVSDRVAAEVRATTPIEREFAAPQRGGRLWFRALRVHHWLKNLLVFLPLLTSFSFGQLDKVVAAVVAFVAMSLMASGTYLLNDMWDLDNDRRHPRKRHRPLASGELPMLWGLGAATVLVAGASLLALQVSAGLLGMVLFYLAFTTLYSWSLKRQALVDVIALALLYTLRVLVGAVAIAVQVTPWLLAFSMFAFVSLALVKRCSELVAARGAGHEETNVRGYRPADLDVLLPLGVGASLCSIVVFGLFAATAIDSHRYPSAMLLWLVAIGMFYWMGRLWLMTMRGRMHDDPLVFTLRDGASRTALAAMVLTTAAAHFL